MGRRKGKNPNVISDHFLRVCVCVLEEQEEKEEEEEALLVAVASVQTPEKSLGREAKLGSQLDATMKASLAEIGSFFQTCRGESRPAAVFIHFASALAGHT